MNVCPRLREWLIATCTLGNIGFVIDPEIVEKFCKNGNYRECPFTRELQSVAKDRER
ncbi:MAG: hypothetical protein ABSA46_16715 [Thermodesulfovibrionales bacterium]